MPYAVELFFDPASEKRIRAIWERLAAIGITYLHEGDSRPHVSLAVCDSIAIEPTIHLLDRFAGSTAGFPVTFVSLGIFPGAEPVVFFSPKVTIPLLELHWAFLESFEPMATNIWPNYSPSHWIPHCTLAAGCPPECFEEALEICRAEALPFTAEIVEIGFVEFRPVKPLHSAVLCRS
jgi:2'-5' RNA ligase